MTCWGGEGFVERADGEALSHALHIQPIWDAHCVVCHAGTEANYLDLRPESAYTWLTEPASHIAVPGDPDSS